MGLEHVIRLTHLGRIGAALATQRIVAENRSIENQVCFYDLTSPDQLFPLLTWALTLLHVSEHGVGPTSCSLA